VYLRAPDLKPLPEVDRPHPYRTLRRKPAPPPLYVTPPAKGAVGSYGDAALDWLEERLPKWRAQEWQRQAARLALQYDRWGRLLPSTALVMVPRQNGKSTLAQAIIGWWMDKGPGGTVIGAATERKQARLVYDAIYRLFASTPDLYTRARITAHEGIYLGSSWYQTISREAGSARGYASSLVYFDELLTQEDAEVWDALRYSLASASSPLLLATSTAGFPASVILNDLEDRGIRIATGQEAPDPSYAFIKWGVPDYAPINAETITAANPAVASGLHTLKRIAAERSTSLPGSFRRERLNQRTTVAETVLPPGAWAMCQAPAAEEVRDPWVLAVDASPGWQRVTLVAAWEDPAQGRLPIEVVAELRGTEVEPVGHGVLTARVLEVVGRRMPKAILYERASAVAPVMERLSVDHPEWPIQALTTREVFDACQVVYQAVLTRRLAHVGDPLLDAQWGQVAKVERDGGFRWTRRKSAGYIDGVMAATIAAWGAARGIAPEPPLQVFV